MNKIVILSCLLFSQTGFAETLKAKIHALENVGQKTLVKFDNGRVAWSTKNVDLVAGQTVTAEINDKSDLVSVAPALELVSEVSDEKSFTEERPVFEPTVVGGYDQAVALFERLDAKFRRVSECSDRAHVWSYDEFKTNGIKTEKVFIFFTASYINRNNFKWWFHVAPLVSVNEGDAVQKRVLDYRYTDGPKTIKEWSDLLVFSKRDCKMTTKFSEYDVNPQTEDCYMMIDSMYYRLPDELSKQETAGTYRSSFNDYEVSGARFRAFRKGNL